MGGMAAISVLVGGVGIVNVMLANVADRRLEIGLKLALGAPPVVIGLEFLAGAVVFALAGAALGLVGAWALLRLLALAGLAQVALAPPAALFAAGLAGVVGIVAGAYPAALAARLQPREILRDA
jgi:putative ABC transport system permease protein